MYSAIAFSKYARMQEYVWLVDIHSRTPLKRVSKHYSNIYILTHCTLTHALTLTYSAIHSLTHTQSLTLTLTLTLTLKHRFLYTRNTHSHTWIAQSVTNFSNGFTDQSLNHSLTRSITLTHWSIYTDNTHSHTWIAQSVTNFSNGFTGNKQRIIRICDVSSGF